MFPKTGNVFPGGNDRESSSTNYAAMIATALRTELGDSHRATKTVMRWTGASERTVKHWLAGLHGPGGPYLIVLMRQSQAVFESVLTAADRRDAFVAARMLAAHGSMVEAMRLFNQDKLGRTRTSETPNKSMDRPRVGSMTAKMAGPMTQKMTVIADSSCHHPRVTSTLVSDGISMQLPRAKMSEQLIFVVIGVCRKRRRAAISAR